MTELFCWLTVARSSALQGCVPRLTLLRSTESQAFSVPTDGA